MGWFRNKDKGDENSGDNNGRGAIIDPLELPEIGASPNAPSREEPVADPESTGSSQNVDPDVDPVGQTLYSADAEQSAQSGGPLDADADAQPDETAPDSGQLGEILAPAAPRRREIRSSDLNQLPEIPVGTQAPAPIINPIPPAVIGPDRPCPNCAVMAPANAKFCEACGTDLVDGEPLDQPAVAGHIHTEPCVSCSADPSEIDDGWCSACGTKQPAPRDHMETDLGWLAVVTDKGLRHHHNEDAVSIATVDDAAIVVVCDGVSTTNRPEDASQLAADVIRRLLVAAVESGADVTEALHDAIEQAHKGVAQLALDSPGEAPSCTVVAAVAERDTQGEIHATIAWLGDSRAFWITPVEGKTQPGVERLTEDHSWSRDQLEAGILDPAVIAADARAHSITRWLGADSTDHTPDITHFTATAGQLLVCTDGLWNYAEDVDAMAARVNEREGAPLHTSRELVTFAKDSGGHDNISVAIVDFDWPPVGWNDDTERDGDD